MKLIDESWYIGKVSTKSQASRLDIARKKKQKNKEREPRSLTSGPDLRKYKSQKA